MDVIFLQILIVGGLFGEMAILLWQHTPAVWFCDYGEIPGDAERQSRGRKGYSRIVAYSGFWIWVSCWIAFYHELHADFWFWGAAALCAVQIVLADVKFQIIPDQWILLLGIFFGGQALWEGKFLTYLSQALLVVVFIWTLALVIERKRHTLVLGFGDIKLLFVLGLFGGLAPLLQMMANACLFCGIGCGALLLFKKKKMEDSCAFGPYLIGAWALQLFT